MNYVYDGSGNLIRDYQDGTQIRWNSQGKVIQVRKVTASVNKELYYIYDAAGQRVIKKEIDYLALLDSSWATYYVRDANETVIAVYRQKLHYNGDTSDICTPVEPGTGTDTDNDGVDGTGAPCDNCAQWNPWQEDYDGDGLGDACDPCPLAGGECESVTPGPMVDTTSLWQAQGETVLAEWHIYGSAAQGRLGIWKPDRNRDTTATATVYFTRQVNLKEYELKDHLGNVTVVISDLKVADANVGMGAWPRPFSVEVRSYSHYYPFGMLQPGRHGNSEGYRYGYNGKEGDNSWKGVGNVYDYGFRVYDPRIGRFLSVDPLAMEYPWYTPYQFAGNKPVLFIDLDGLEEMGSILQNAGAGLTSSGASRLNTEVTMDAGHGDIAAGSNLSKTIYQPGASYPPGSNNPEAREKDYALKVERDIAGWLSTFGISVGRTRTGDINVLPERAVQWRLDRANKSNSRVLVSIHLYQDEGLNGMFVYTRSDDGSDHFANSKKLAEFIAAEQDVLPENPNGAVVDEKVRGFRLGLLHGFHGEASVIIELGRIDDKQIRDAINNPDTRSKLAYQIASGIRRYLQHSSADERVNSLLKANENLFPQPLLSW